MIMLQVARKGETQRFAKHGKLGNRRLLWHGTNVAVVAAVLQDGAAHHAALRRPSR